MVVDFVDLFARVAGCIEGIPGHYGMFRGSMGCSRRVVGLFRAVSGCSGGVPGMFRGVPGCSGVACSRRSNSGARKERERKIKRAKEREKTRGDWGKHLPSLPSFFFPLFRSLYFSLVLHYLNAWNKLQSVLLC